MQQGDEAGILLEFLTRLDGNGMGYVGKAMSIGPDEDGKYIGFSFSPGQATPEQGGDTLFSTFDLNTVAIGQPNVDNIDDLRPVAKWLVNNLVVKGGEPGTRLADGAVISCIHAGPLTFKERDSKGVLRWYHGCRWVVKIQPDVTAY